MIDGAKDKQVHMEASPIINIVLALSTMYEIYAVFIPGELGEAMLEGDDRHDENTS